MSDTDSKTNNEKKGFAAHPENINRKGRPKKGESYTDIIRQMGESVDDHGYQLKERLVKKLWDKALIDNDLAAQKYLFDRVDGQPTAKVNLETDVVESIVEAVDNFE